MPLFPPVMTTTFPSSFANDYACYAVLAIANLGIVITTAIAQNMTGDGNMTTAGTMYKSSWTK
jgi:hypothetical protein